MTQEEWTLDCLRLLAQTRYELSLSATAWEAQYGGMLHPGYLATMRAQERALCRELARYGAPELLPAYLPGL